MTISLFEITLRIASGAFGLRLLFSALRTDWPANYFAASDIKSGWVSATLPRYILYRFAPVFFVTLCTMVGLEDSLTVRLFIAGSISLLHVLDTSVRATLPGRSSGMERASSLLVTHLSIALGVLFSGAAAVAIQPSLAGLLPTGKEYIQALTTAVFVAVLASVAVKVTRMQETDSIEEAVEAMDGQLRSTIIRYSHEFKIDSDIGLAIFATELTQRPQWIRIFENCLARTGLVRTFGLGQSSRFRPADLDEDVSNTLRPLAGSNFAGLDPSLKRQWAEIYFERHNASRVFVEFATQCWWQFENQDSKAGWIGLDGNSVLRCTGLKRVGASWHAAGTVTRDVVTLVAHTEAMGEVSVQIDAADDVNTFLRTWSLNVPLSGTTVRLEARPQTGAICATTEARSVTVYGY